MPKRKGKRHAAIAKNRSRRLRSDITRKSSKSELTLVVMLRAKESQELLLEAELRALIHPTRKEDGCLRYDLYKSAESANAFLLLEVWASREHHRLHTQTPHFLRWDARKDALLASREATFWQPLA